MRSVKDFLKEDKQPVSEARVSLSPKLMQSIAKWAKKHAENVNSSLDDELDNLGRALDQAEETADDEESLYHSVRAQMLTDLANHLKTLAKWHAKR